jgi:glyoxylase I family protein
MSRGSMNHLALTVSDLERSAKFYDRVLGFIGYVRVGVPQPTQQLMKTRLLAWAGPHGSVTLRPGKGEAASRKHDRNAPGLHHFAFSAEGRADVDGMHELLKSIGAQILDAPAEYPYGPGYYAVYFADPDCVKIEFVYWPRA